MNAIDDSFAAEDHHGSSPRRASSSAWSSGGEGVERGGGGGTEGGKGGGAVRPLKRGGACLYCRKRKLRCTGLRPCVICDKHNVECTYDEPGKPRSRVKLLEDKIAGLENILLNGLPVSSSSLLHRTRSTQVEGATSPSSFPYPSRTRNPPGSDSLDEQEAFSSALQTLLRGESNVDDNRMEDSGLDRLAFAQAWTSSTPLLPPQPQPSSLSPSYAQQSTSPESFFAQSNAPAWSPSFGVEGRGYSDLNIIDPTSPPLDLNLFPSPSSSSQKNTGYQASLSSPFAAQQPTTPASNNPSPNAASECFAPSSPVVVMPEQWGDGTVLPPGMREHLLKLFFQRRRQLCWSLHVGRFLGSIDASSEGRPAPALLFAMYTCASRFSPNSQIRDLEETFLSLARRNIELGMSVYSDQRFVQVIQASLLLSSHLYSKSRYMEGWVQGGTTMRLAQSARLHRLSASEISFAMRSFAEGRPLPSTRGQAGAPSNALSPPLDGVELAERVWVFWSSFLHDRAGCAASGRSGISHGEVETPFPRPPEEYERGVLQESDFKCISDLYSSDSTTRRPTDSLGGILLEAITLLIDSSLLGDDFLQHNLRLRYSSRPSTTPPIPIPIPSSSNSLNSTRDSTPSLSGSTPETPPAPLPAEYVRLKKALSSLVKGLPMQYRNPARKNWQGGIPPWTKIDDLHPDQGTFDAPSPLNVKIGISPVLFSVHAILRTSFMLLYSHAAKFDSTYRPKALDAAVSAVELLRIVVDIDYEPILSLAVLFKTRTDLLVLFSLPVGQLDIFLVVLWRLQSQFLIGEVKQLRLEGQTERASTLLLDIEVLILALKRMGQVWAFANGMETGVTRRMKDLAVREEDRIA